MHRHRMLLLAALVALALAAGGFPTAAAATTYGNERFIPHAPGPLFAQSISVDAADNLFIADSYNSSVWRIDAGGVQTRISPPYPDSSQAGGVAETPDGKLYVGASFIMWQVDGPSWTGSYRQVRPCCLESAGQVATDAAGNVYELDTFWGWVVKFDPSTGDSSVLLPVLETPRNTPGDFISPRGVAVDGAGNVYASDTARNQVWKLTPDGHASVLPFTGLLWPKGLAADAAGDVFVADSGNGRVVELAPDGTQTTLPFTHLNTWSGSEQGDVGGVSGVAVDPAGNVFALDRGPSNIWEVSPVQPQAITFTSSAPAAASVGGSYAVSATGGGSGNPVTFSIDASSSSGACSVSGSTVSFTGTGTCVVDANQAGGVGYAAAPQLQQSFAIARGAQTIAFLSAAPTGATVGGAYVVSASGGASGNTVTFSTDTPGVCAVTGSVVSFDHAGTCDVLADQAGNANYFAAPEVSQSFAIGQASQTIAFASAAPAGAVVGGTYAVSATGGASGNAVTFSTDTPGVCRVTGSAVSFDHVGTCDVLADQAGNADYLAAPEVSQSFAIGKGTPALAWASPSAIDFGTPLGASQLDASASVAGSLVYTPAAGTILDPGTQTLSVAFTPSDTADWNGAAASVQVTVNTTTPPITTSSSGPLNLTGGGSAAISGGTVSGPVNISSGGALYVSNGGAISGPLTVGAGGVLVIDAGSVNGPLRVNSDAEIVLCGATISGPLSITGSHGPIRIGAVSGCAGNAITGPVSITNNSGGVSFVGNNVIGSVTITGNSGGFAYGGNTVSGKTTVSGNS